MNPEQPPIIPPTEPDDQPPKPRLQDALLLLGAAGACSGVFYLFLGKLTESLVYGSMLGAALAAIGVEFVKFTRSYRAEHGAGKVGVALSALVTQAFRIGFVTTFVAVSRELFKLLGVKLLVSLIIALSAWWALSKGASL